MSLAFVIIRWKFASGSVNSDIKNLLNNPFLGVSIMDKLATIIYTVGAYILLIIVPIYLSCDYDYNVIPIQHFTDFGVIASLIIVILLVFIVILQIKKRTILSYSILFFAVTFILVSNVLFPIGTIMAERFIFIPSFGFCLAAAYYLNRTIKINRILKNESPFSILKNNRLAMMILLIPLGFFSYRSIARNIDWNDNLSLFSADVKSCSNSANLNKDFGSSLFYKVKENPNKKIE